MGIPIELETLRDARATVHWWGFLAVLLETLIRD